MNEEEIYQEKENNAKETKREPLIVGVYDIVETLAKVTVFVMLLFAFVLRLNVVSGHSMDTTLYGGELIGDTYKGGEWLAVSDLGYEPTRGDIVILHDIDARPYDEPLVKRVIAVGGQTIDIDFDTWVVTVDGEVIDEDSYINLSSGGYVIPTVTFPLTLQENEIFVMGDNRNVSADSRIIGPVDKRCVVGKALARISPLKKFTIFSNPYTK